MAEKDFTVYELYSIYGKMLTETQARAVEDYFGLDLSLGEIAQNRGTSRQAVKDAIACAEKQLFNLEHNLKLYDKIKRARAVISAVGGLDNSDNRNANGDIGACGDCSIAQALKSILDILEE